MNSEDLENALSKIRPHTSSSLAHQKAPANLLTALEATFKDQNTERTPAAYFAGLLTALEGTIEKEKNTKFSLGDGDLLPAELYLLALVGPFVPPPVIRANLNTLVSLTAPLWTPLYSSAPPLRSQLSLYNAVLRAADRAQLETQSVRQSFATILQFCLDPRPKVRKRAADLVKDVLSSPPSPLLRHPFSERVGEWTLNALSDVNSLKQKGKKHATADDAVNAAIHLLAFIRPILSYLPPSSLPSITTALLGLPRLGNPYLSQSAYGVLSDLLSIPDDPVMSRNVDSSISELLHAILTSAPLKTDVDLLPSWMQVVGQIMVVYGSVDPDTCMTELPRAWKTVFPNLESTDSTTRRQAAATLGQLSQCIKPALIGASLGNEKAALSQMISQTSKALDSIAYVRAIPDVLYVVSALIRALRHRPEGRESPTAAERLLMPLIQKIGDMRLKKGFEYKEAADSVLRAAMSIIGPEVLVSVMPLNLEREDRAAGREPRAFLLPLLVDNHPSPLRHFISYFVPLTERMFDLQQCAEAEGRASEAKVWSVLISQVWNGLPAYCYRTPDLRESFNAQFAQMLSQLLYNQPELRPPVLKALRVIVESNTAKPDDGDNDEAVPEDEIVLNLAFLRTQTESWLAVLFNVFGTVGRNEQPMVGDVIGVWASIADSNEMSKTCRKVVDMFTTNLGKLSAAISSNTKLNGTQQRSIVSAMQDILVILVPYLSQEDARTVFDLCLTPDVLKIQDNGVQKRAYKLLSKILLTGKIDLDAETLFAKMDEVSEDTLSAAKKDRLTFLKALLAGLPSNALHVIPSLIPEAVLGTKEPSEKARQAAFDLIVAMGYKMKEGGIVKRAKLNGMDEDDMTETAATLDEYFTMMAGGLAGASAHMISATITAISRLIFEFKDAVSQEMQKEVFLTFLEYLKSANREIVKSTLGFVKLVIHTQPLELLRPHLELLVPVLLRWSHDHKNHFKEKVRHIFERLIRRVGYDAVYSAANADKDEEAAKVLSNIKKRKDRTKRKKAARRTATEEGESDGDDAVPRRAAAEDAFDEVLYGSESEDELSDEEMVRPRAQQGKGGKDHPTKGARLRVDDDDPMDLLHGANTRVTSARKQGRKPGAEASTFKTDPGSGKMLIESDSENGAEPDEDARLAGAACRETLTSVDGFTRDQRGRVKFNKDTKKRRREAEDGPGDDDVEMVDIEPGTEKEKRRGKHRKPVKIGQDFKAKRAGGDVKKGGVEPYAYLPLSQAAKAAKGRSGQRITVTGRR